MGLRSPRDGFGFKPLHDLDNHNFVAARANKLLLTVPRGKTGCDLPAGVKFIVMVDGAVAQPVKANVCNAAKIPFSDAKIFRGSFS